MQWKLSEEQEAYQEALRGWLASVAGPEQVRRWLGIDRERADAAEFEARFVDDRMAGVGVPEELGGQGGGVVELALTAEELARAAAPSAAWLATTLALPTLEGRPELVKSAVEGDHVALLISAEERPGGRSTSLLTTDPAGRVSGTLPRVVGADRASTFVAVVAGHGGPRLRLVEADVDGVHVRPRKLLDASRSVADVHLDNVASRSLEADAVDCLARVADLVGVLVAADALGAMERMLDLAVEYSGQRHQFGVPIGSFQAVKHAAASILVDVEAGRSGVYYAAAALEAGHDDKALYAAAMKSQVTAAAARAADTALTMHGAIGYTWEHDLHLYYKRARLDEQLFGAPAVWNELLAHRLLSP